MSADSYNVTNEAALAEFIQERGPHCLIVARHGETVWNAEGRLQGQQDTQLNSRGRSQALATGQFLKSVPLLQVHSSTLQRCRKTADRIVEDNISRPTVAYDDLLRETALGVLEGEMKDQQSTPELTRHYQEFSQDEINYRIPDGETLHDVAARVEQFFVDHSDLLSGTGIHLIVAHRNLNKMIVKHLLGLTFDEGFQVEQEHQRLYLYFTKTKELWSCWVEGTTAHLTRGYATISSAGSYA